MLLLITLWLNTDVTDLRASAMFGTLVPDLTIPEPELGQHRLARLQRLRSLALVPSGPILLLPRCRLPSVARICLAMRGSSPHHRCCVRLRAILDRLTRWAG